MNLLAAGLLVFGVGVAVNYFGGDDFRTIALVVQVAGAAILFANAARSRRESRDDQGRPHPGS